MGALFSRLSDLFNDFRNDPARILMVGLDAAGKTLVSALILNEIKNVSSCHLNLNS